MPFPERRPLPRRAAAAALVLAASSGVAAAAPAPAAVALCDQSQQVLFHCSLGAKSVSLCGAVAGEHLGALQYRYGRPGRVELQWPADPNSAGGTGPRFTASMAALSPAAQVRQLWFDSGPTRYLISQCTGGDCPYAAGLAVLRGQRLLSSWRCLASADDRAWFSPLLGRFGNDADSSQSNTPALKFDDVDNGVERLYPQLKR